MKKFVTLPIQLEALIVDTQPVARVHVPPNAVAEFTLCVQLLLQGFVDSLLIAGNQQSAEFCIGSEIAVLQSESHHVSMTLTKMSLDFVAGFFMRYYRDGAAEVDHIDLETDSGGYVTLTIDQALPPVSVDEAKRRLGIPE